MKEKLFKFLKVLGVIFLVLFLLYLEIDRESGHIKNIPYFGTTDVQYNDFIKEFGEIRINGSWGGDSHYPNYVDITCNIFDNTCTVEVADIKFDTLGLTKEYFNITKWDKNFIEAEYSNSVYLFKLVINRKTQELFRSKYPLDNKEILGSMPTEYQVKLIGGIEAYQNTLDYKYKELSFINNPVLKTIDFVLKKFKKEQ